MCILFVNTVRVYRMCDRHFTLPISVGSRLRLTVSAPFRSAVIDNSRHGIAHTAHTHMLVTIYDRIAVYVRARTYTQRTIFVLSEQVHMIIAECE